MLKHGTVVDERMELAVLPTGIDLGRKFRKKSFVIVRSSKPSLQHVCIYAGYHRLEPVFQKRLGDLVRIAFPKREKGQYLSIGRALI